MNSVRYVKPDFPPDAFAGTATYYALYRVPYPDALLRDLVERAGVTGGGRLLDLACGPGRVALSLASSFRDVWAIDLEPEMIEVGREEAKQRSVTNIRWMVGKAEELEAQPASFELLTIGEAFHRLDQRLIARQALQWLSPGCCLAVMGCFGIVSGTERWQRIVADTVRKWLPRRSASGDGSARARPGSGADHTQLVLQDTGFEDVGSYPFICPHDWTVESIIGNLYSTSRCSKNVLGDSAEAFEADLRNALLAYDATGRYPEAMRWGYTLGRKPSDYGKERGTAESHATSG